MARDILDTSLRKQIFAKYDNHCHVCHYHLKPALRVHHIVPVNLGGQDNDEYQLLETMRQVINYIPASIIPHCSFRLVSSGKYISINVMNYLLFRAPAYGDLGGKPQYDCYLIFPMDAEMPHFITADRTVFEFKDFDCINLGLFSDEILQLPEGSWQSFADACEMATHAKRTREWPSNINI